MRASQPAVAELGVVRRFTDMTPRTIIFSIGAVLLLCGCPEDPAPYPTLKLTAEEAGYQGEFGLVHSRARYASRSLYEASNAIRVQRALRDQGRQTTLNTEMDAAFTRIKQLYSDYSKLKATSPPPSMRAAHLTLLSVLSTAKSVRAGSDVEAECLAFFQESKELEMQVTRRPNYDVASADLNVAFKPLGLPVRINSDGTFALDIGFSTPIGSVSVEQKWQGIRKMAITYQGMTRYVSLDRDFSIRLHLPPEYNSVVIGGDARGGVIRINVERAASMPVQ